MLNSPICRPVIVLEGPDGAGKSTLAARLSSVYNWPVVHTGGPNKSRMDVFDRIADLGFLTRKNVIFDRVGIISEPVYSKIADRASYLSDEEVFNLANAMRPVVIYCRLESSERMVEKILESPKPHKPPEYLEKVKQNHATITSEYDRVIRLLPPEIVVSYNWERDDWVYLEGAIARRLEPCAD